MGASTVTDSAPSESPVKLAITHIPSHLRLWLVAGVILWLDLWSKAWVFGHLPSNESRPFIPGVIDFRRSLNEGAVFGSLKGHVELFIVASLFALGFVVYLFAFSSRAHRALHVVLGLILAGAIGNLYDRAMVQADVLVYTARNGETVTVVGKIIDQAPDAQTEIDRMIQREESRRHERARANDTIWIGAWPDGANAQEFKRSKVTVRQQGVVRDFIKFVPRFPKWVPRLGGRDIWPWVFNVADAALVCGVGALLCTSWLERRQQHQESIE